MIFNQISWRHIYFLLFFIALVACGNEPETIKVYITTTPEQVSSEQSMNKTVDYQRATQPTITRRHTSTPTQTASPTATNTPTVTPSFTPSSEPSLLDFVPPADQLPTLRRSAMGIQVHPNIVEEEWRFLLGEAQRLGFGWIKMQIPWDLLEPQPGQYDPLFYTYVIRVQDAHVNGFQVLLSFVDAPQWARPAEAREGFKGPPADPQQLANFITAFLNETKPQDRRVAAVEIWNEPNLRDREWDGVPLDGGTYMRYFAAGYNAVKAIDPSIIVITAGLAPVGDLDGAVSDRRFLQQMYDAGLAQYDAKIGVHPYGWGNAPDERCCIEDRPWGNNPVFFFQDTLYDYIDIIQRNGHNTQLWITEFGWGTYQGVGENGEDISPPPAGAEFFDLITPQEQAEYTLRAFEIVQQPPLSDWIGVSILWNLNFATLPFVVEQRQEQAGYSLYDASGNPRLVYFYLLVSRRTD
ncbi:MAG: hypothetical protein CUN55_11495 [Phototrophicales bacterium]|nr:MAG: hypothetical protein CUN55_11495 [Phototrophicales bacterium]